MEDAVRHHLDVYQSARSYNPTAAGVDLDLTLRVGPIEPVLGRLDATLRSPIELAAREFTDLAAFVRDGLLDPRTKREHLCKLVPRSVPSGAVTLFFQGRR